MVWGAEEDLGTWVMALWHPICNNHLSVLLNPQERKALLLLFIEEEETEA